MSKEKNISEMENMKEQFVALSKEVYPLIEQIREALAKSPFGESASISISTDNYFPSFHILISTPRYNFFFQ